MIQRVMPDLMGMKNILAINDEAHHCYEKETARSRRSRTQKNKRPVGEEYVKKAAQHRAEARLARACHMTSTTKRSLIRWRFSRR